MEIPKSLTSGTGVISFRLEGATLEQVERCRRFIHTLFDAGVFGVKGADIIMQVDHEGDLRSVDFKIQRWRLGKPSPPVTKLYAGGSIYAEIT